MGGGVTSDLDNVHPPLYPLPESLYSSWHPAKYRMINGSQEKTNIYNTHLFYSFHRFQPFNL